MRGLLVDNSRSDYKNLVSQWRIPDISWFACSDKGVENKPTIKKLPRELSQQIIPQPRGTSNRVSSSLQDPPRTTEAPVDRFTHEALKQSEQDNKRSIAESMLMHCSLYQYPPQLLMNDE
jgi:hypothetical protein